uniref:uncharacterized protein LOC122583120 n=1 Tax=Erigeron canadensis TaxID=72917 RepID=UPI001CB94C2E|nr:uncharacterized protein LOC122583120 [Erigeron canadensis]
MKALNNGSGISSTFDFGSSSNSNVTPHSGTYQATTTPCSMINNGTQTNLNYAMNAFNNPISMCSSRSNLPSSIDPLVPSTSKTTTSVGPKSCSNKGKQKSKTSNKQAKAPVRNVNNLHKQKSQVLNNIQIPRIDVEINDDMLDDSYDKRKGLSLAYKDHGDQIYECSKCHALLWEAEMLRGNQNGKKTVYSFCCKGGDVELPPVVKPPPVLYNLFSSKNPIANNFMKHIRAYNMMFSFTSMGGKVNQGSLKGRGPYVFRLQGQNYHRMGSLLLAPGDQPKFSQLYIFDSKNEEANRERAIRMVRDCVKDNELQNVSLKLIANRNKDGRVYNLPTTSEVAGLIIGDIDSVRDSWDIILRKQSGGLQRISELHPSYLALQYPLLFPFGEDGFRLGIKHRGIAQDSQKKRTKLTMREYFVTQYKTDLGSTHCYFMHNLTTNIENGTTDAASTGKCILLPSSFTGGSRYMMQKYLDAMAICKSVGYPDLFITITCNPNWPEIYRCLVDKNLTPEDRPDILARMFKIKLDEIIKDFVKEQFFGPVQAVIYTVEFQKRGLPHAHICLFLVASNKFPRATDVDKYISAEIPNEKEDPELYVLVKQFMMHGPCRVDNPDCPCLVKGKCTKNFSKKWKDETAVDSEGYPVYRRRNNGNTIEKNGKTLDNGMVVPYNATLLRRYQCHINVEWYVSASEACWIIFGFDIHYRHPRVEIFPFHKANEQSIVYDDEAQLCDAVSNPTVKRSMFLEWMKLNAEDKFARTLKYVQIPQFYAWIRKTRKWQRRTVEGHGSIGRISYVPPSLGDVYYLRILLNHVVGPQSFDALLTVNGRKCKSYKEACFKLGLLDDDKEYVNAILEASHWASASYLRTFFVQLLLSSSVARPDDLWKKTCKVLSEDILHM